MRGTCGAWLLWFGEAAGFCLATEACLRKNDTVLKPDSTTSTQGVTAEPKLAKRPTQSQSTDGASTASAGRDGAGQSDDASARGGARAVASSVGRDAGPAAETVVGGAAEERGAAGQTGAGDGSSPSMAAAGSGAGTSEQSGTAESGVQGSNAIEVDPGCDLSGAWIARQITISEALGVSQFSNNWYYFEVQQTGTEVQVTQHFDCGVTVLGTVTVTLPRSSLQAQLTHNQQAGRTATMRKDGATCRLETMRFWSIRGAEELRFLPDGVRDSEKSVAAVAQELPLPTPENPDGAIDVDGDGKLGLAYEITGLVSGIRNSVQRDWTRWFSAPGYEIVPSSDWPDDITIRADFDNEESVLDPSSGLLASGSTPKTNGEHQVTLRFLGRDASDPRRAAVVKADQVQTCYAIQDAMPAKQLE